MIDNEIKGTKSAEDLALAQAVSQFQVSVHWKKSIANVIYAEQEI